MINVRCKNVSEINERIPKHQTKSDNKLKKCANLSKEDWIKP